MSAFSSVDDAADPERLVRFLDAAAAGQSGIKHYAAAAHALRRPARPVLDVGCGTGQDLALLGAGGVEAIGVDPSAVMVAAARGRVGPAVSLARGFGHRLPFRRASFGGARVERVLMHVEDPAAVLAEIVRCVEPGGLLNVFEPDWSRFEVRTAEGTADAGWLSSARHPDVGGRLWALVEDAGCEVLDRVEELSVWRSLETLVRIAGYPHSVDRAVAAGRIGREAADAWVREQEERARAGSLHGLLPKVLIVARTHSSFEPRAGA